MDTQIIEARKKLNRLLATAKKETKTKTCPLCEKKCDSFVQSHSVPKYILKGIADNGMLQSPTSIIYPLKIIFNENIGAKKAGTFFSICKKCDNSYFEIYEKEESISLLFEDFKNKNISNFSQKILASIFLKSLLLDNYKKKLSSGDNCCFFNKLTTIYSQCPCLSYNLDK